MWHEGMVMLLFSFIRVDRRLLCIVVKLTPSVLTYDWLGPSLGTRHNSILKWKRVHICFFNNFSSDLQSPIKKSTVEKYIPYVSSESWGQSLFFEYVLVYKSWGETKEKIQPVFYNPSAKISMLQKITPN